MAVVGWSNGATILNNCLAEQASSHTQGRNLYGADAAVSIACPLNMPLASGNLKRWFHSNVYDRSIARSLSTKIAEWKHLFLNAEGASKPVPAWEGLGPGKTFVADESVLTGNLRTIREIDEAITRRCFGFDTVGEHMHPPPHMTHVSSSSYDTYRRCFGFDTVDEYYRHASSDQRLNLIDVPCMMINAVDDPIAYLGPSAGNLLLPSALKTNDKLCLVLTQQGGHLGWCDDEEPWKSPKWIECITLQFLEKTLARA